MPWLIENKIFNQWLSAYKQITLHEKKTLEILKEEAQQQLSDDNCGPGDQAPTDEESIDSGVAVE